MSGQVKGRSALTRTSFPTPGPSSPQRGGETGRAVLKVFDAVPDDDVSDDVVVDDAELVEHLLPAELDGREDEVAVPVVTRGKDEVGHHRASLKSTLRRTQLLMRGSHHPTLTVPSSNRRYSLSEVYVSSVGTTSI
jgi:hypothetical protein